jgi:hypothetical protein
LGADTLEGAGLRLLKLTRKVVYTENLELLWSRESLGASGKTSCYSFEKRGISKSLPKVKENGESDYSGRLP